MSVKKTIVFLFYLFVFIETIAQCESGGIGFQMDGGFSERGHTVVRSNQGGLMIGGITSGGFGSGDWMISKINSSNSIEWCKHFGTNNNNESGDNVLIQPINTGGYIIAGFISTGGTRVLVFSRIDENGNIIWTKQLDENNAPGETAADIMQLMDGNFVIVGTTNTYSSGSSDGFAFKFDIDGNVMWAKAYGNGPNEHFYSCLELPNGDLLCTGEASNAGSKGWVVKLDPQGNLYYSKTLNTPGYSLLMDCKLSASNTIFCTGLESYQGVNKLMTMSFETNETINFATVIIGDNSVTVGSNLELHSSGDLMIAGVKGNTFANDNQPFFLRTTSNGIPISSQSLNFGTAPSTLIRSQNSVLLNDLPVMIGWNINGANTDLALTSLNACDQNDCTSDLGYTHVVRTYAWSNLSVSTSPFNAFLDIIFNESDYEITTEVLCQTQCEVSIDISTPPLICTSSEVNFSLTALNGTTYGDVDWQIGTQVYTNESNIDTTFISAGNVSYQITVFDSSNTCSTSTSGILQIIETPLVNLPDVISICDFPTDTLSTLGTYTWTSGVLPANPASINQEGTYTASYTNECGTSTDQTLVGLIEVINPVLFSDSVLCPGGQVVTVTFPITAQVFLNSNPLSSPYSINTGGIYTIEYVSPEGCSDFITTTVDDFSLIDEYTLPFDTLVICSLPSNDFEDYYDEFTFFQDEINSPFEGVITDFGTYIVTPTSPCGNYFSEVVVIDGIIDFSNFEDSYILCENETLQLPINSLNYTYTINGQTVEMLEIDEPGIYNINTTDNTCSNGITITVISNGSSIAFPSEFCITEANLFDFNALDSTVQWTYEGANIGENMWNPSIGSNNVYYTDDCGTTEYQVTVNPDYFCDCLTYVPNAFTPNDDAFNQVWNPVFSIKPYWFEYKVFNRWGEEIFSNYNDLDSFWQGNHTMSGEYYCQNEVYSWLLKYQCESNAEILEKRGFVVEIR